MRHSLDWRRHLMILKSYNLDAQIHIPGYDIRRSNRSKRLGGGVLLYS